MVKNNSWNRDSGVPISVSDGGTGLATLPAHSVLLGNGALAPSSVSPDSSGKVVFATAGAPVFNPLVYPSTSSAGTLLAVTSSQVVTSTNTSSVSPSFVNPSAVAATTHSVLVANTDNSSSSSNSSCVATVGGGGAGDPTLVCSVNSGGASWSVGLKNSASSALMINPSSTLGASSLFTTTTSGIVSKVFTPSVIAYKHATTPNVTGDGTLYQIVFNVELGDSQGNYDINTGIFTAPVTGYYLVNTSIDLTTLEPSHTSCKTFITTTLATYSGNSLNPWNSNWGTTKCLNQKAFAKLRAGDTLTVSVSVSGGPKTVGISGFSDCRTMFSISLIC
jgi:hypothetical protein